MTAGIVTYAIRNFDAAPLNFVTTSLNLTRSAMRS